MHSSWRAAAVLLCVVTGAVAQACRCANTTGSAVIAIANGGDDWWYDSTTGNRTCDSEELVGNVTESSQTTIFLRFDVSGVLFSDTRVTGAVLRVLTSYTESDSFRFTLKIENAVNSSNCSDAAPFESGLYDEWNFPWLATNVSVESHMESADFSVFLNLLLWRHRTQCPSTITLALRPSFSGNNYRALSYESSPLSAAQLILNTTCPSAFACNCSSSLTAHPIPVADGDDIIGFKNLEAICNPENLTEPASGGFQYQFYFDVSGILHSNANVTQAFLRLGVIDVPDTGNYGIIIETSPYQNCSFGTFGAPGAGYRIWTDMDYNLAMWSNFQINATTAATTDTGDLSRIINYALSLNQQCPGKLGVYMYYEGYSGDHTFEAFGGSNPPTLYLTTDCPTAIPSTVTTAAPSTGTDPFEAVNSSQAAAQAGKIIGISLSLGFMCVVVALCYGYDQREKRVSALV